MKTVFETEIVTHLIAPARQDSICSDAHWVLFVMCSVALLQGPVALLRTTLITTAPTTAQTHMQLRASLQKG